MIKKIYHNLPKYFKGVFNSFCVSLEGLILDFALAIIVVQIKTLLDNAHINNPLEKNL